MKRYIRTKNSNKPVMTAAQKRGYAMAIPYIKKICQSNEGAGQMLR